MQDTSRSTYVWDIFVRCFHWSVATAFTLAYLTAESWRKGHKWFGYFIFVAIVARLLWGVIGTPNARFSSFFTSPRRAMDYVRNVFSGKAPRYIGHNPAGGWMIIALLLTLLATTFSGMWMIAPSGKGPLAYTFLAAWGGHWLEDIHETLANLAIVLITLHLAGVLLSSLAHRENLVRSMITGYKRRDTPS